jgi:hypothetical protein
MIKCEQMHMKIKNYSFFLQVLNKVTVFFFNGTPLFYQCSRTVEVPLNLPVIDHINGVEFNNF